MMGSKSYTSLRFKILSSVVSFLLILVVSFIVYRQGGFKPGAKLIKEFAGSYYMGDGLGLSCGFEIRPDATFEIRFGSDRGDGTVYKGSISVEQRQFVLNTNKTFKTPAFCFHHSVTPVRWGDRKYLIPSDDEQISKNIASYFCQSIKEGDEPRASLYGFAYFRETDINISVTGSPVRSDGNPQCP